MDRFCGGEEGRRGLLWELGALDYREEALNLAAEVEPATLRDLTEAEIMGWEVELLGMTPSDHPMRLCRSQLQAAGILTCTEVARCCDGDLVQVADQVVVRQKRPTAKDHVFLTLEGEKGLINLIIRPNASFVQISAESLKSAQKRNFSPSVRRAGKPTRERH